MKANLFPWMSSGPDRRWLVILAWLVLPGLCSAQEFPVQSHTLTNGLKILVNEDSSIPSVAFYLFYRIGSRDERPGTTGFPISSST